MLRVLGAAATGLLALILLFNLVLRQSEERELTHMLDARMTDLTIVIDDHVRTTSAWMQSSLALLGEFNGVALAMQQQERGLLRKQAQALFDQLNIANSVTRMTFIDTQQHVVLRMHQPGRHGDRIDHYVLRQAVESERSAGGIELSEQGAPILRAAAPWRVNGELIGYLEIGVELQMLLHEIERENDLHLLFRVHKSLVKRQQWPAEWNRWDLLGDDVVVYPIKDADQLLAMRVRDGDIVDLPGHVETFGMRSDDFVDVEGRKIGKLEMLLPMPALGAEQWRFYLTMLWQGGMALLVLLLLYLIIRHTERARRGVESRLRLASEVIAHTRNGVIVTDADANIIDVNPAFEQLTGYGRDEAIGKNPRFLSSGRQPEGVYREMWEALGRENYWHGKIYNRKKSGEIYCEDLSITTLRNENGLVKHYIGLFSDITENEALLYHKEQHQRMRALGTLVGGIAHEFNNLLAGVTGNLFLARSDAGNDPQLQGHLQEVGRLSFEAAEMVRLLMAYAHMGSIRNEPFTIDEFVGEVIGVVRSTLPESVRLSYEPSAETIRIHGDRDQSEQLLLHLINNAVDAVVGVAQPEITISSDLYLADDHFRFKHADVRGERFARISIRDNGCGIDTAEIERIFDPFFTTKEVGKGTGLGLSMVIGVIRSHGGAIEVESEPGAGSCFTIYCPVCDEGQLPAAPDLAAPDDQASVEDQLILIVDDDALIAKTGAKVLGRLGYRCMVAEGGRIGIDLYRANRDRIALVLMDVKMPEMNGIEAAAAIREFDPDARIIFVSGFDVSEMLQHQPHEIVLRKPYRVDDLARVIDQVLAA